MSAPVSFQEALDLVLTEARQLPPEQADLLASLGRVCGRDVVSPADVPPWDHAAGDGFALRSVDAASASEDAPVRLRVVADLPAGRVCDAAVGTRECVRIMTGAPMPAGCDSVLMRESASDEGDGVGVRAPVALGENVRRKGSWVRSGEVLVPAGKRVSAADIGVLSSARVAALSVFRRPVVAVLSTGDELAGGAEALAPGKIAASNHVALEARVLEAGAVPLQLGFVGDRGEELEAAIGRGRSADVVLTTGGTSEGSHDRVREVLDRLGFEPRFRRVAMKPGKSLVFGKLGPSLVFGLPGTPVAALFCFDVLVRPALLKMMGLADPSGGSVRARSVPGLPPVVSLVGKSGSGKTTFLEKLLPALVRRGYAVGTIKHHSHRGFEIDVEGKDSWRHKKAGARQVVVSAPDRLALVRDADRDESVARIREDYCRGLDLVLTEGYKMEEFPKIEVFRKGVHERLLCGAGDALIAVVTDAAVDAGVPCFGLDNAEGVADLLEAAFLSRAAGRRPEPPAGP